MMPKMYSDKPMVVLTKEQKINQIIEAARTLNFSEAIDDIDILSYVGDNGVVYKDRFDYIDTTRIPCSIHFIGGTGYNNFSVPITDLTDDSVNTLYRCVIQK